MPHYLACTDYGWSCTHTNTMSPALILLIAGILAAAIGISAWLRRRSGQ